jgi:hypothetical protein
MDGDIMNYRHIILAALIVVALMVIPVSAADIPIFRNATHESPVGNITSAYVESDTIYVSWENVPPLGVSDQAGVINLYCPDTGFPYWGGMAYGAGGTWSFTLDEMGMSGTDGCWFDLIDGGWIEW